MLWFDLLWGIIEIPLVRSRDITYMLHSCGIFPQRLLGIGSKIWVNRVHNAMATRPSRQHSKRMVRVRQIPTPTKAVFFIVSRTEEITHLNKYLTDFLDSDIYAQRQRWGIEDALTMTRLLIFAYVSCHRGLRRFGYTGVFLQNPSPVASTHRRKIGRCAQPLTS